MTENPFTRHEAVTIFGDCRTNIHTVEIANGYLYSGSFISEITKTEGTSDEGWPIYKVEAAYGLDAWDIAINPEEVK